MTKQFWDDAWDLVKGCVALAILAIVVVSPVAIVSIVLWEILK